MGRHAHPGLAGMTALGDRLKGIRAKSGMSQMTLAERLGFDPKHGYKYVLRLEKGQVPNPTLRTIVSYLEACGAGWQEIIDVLPTRALGPEPGPTVGPATSQQVEPSPVKPPAVEPPAPPPKPKDTRPTREQLRSRRIEERSERARRFWQAVKAAEDKTHALLRSLRVASNLQAGYLAFVRSCCHAIDLRGAAQSGVARDELARLLLAAARQGMDRTVLERVQVVCIEALQPSLPA